MANAFIPRFTVHDWSDEIGARPLEHKTAIVRVVKEQRKLLRFVQQNSAQIQLGSKGLPERMLGFICRIFDLAGGRIRSCTWEQIHEAEQKVTSTVGELLPPDASVPERLRTIAWRAQPHLLDELAVALFDERLEEEYRKDPAESFKLLLLMWVCVEVLDGNWRPPRSFVGDATYEYVDIPPTATPNLDGVELA